MIAASAKHVAVAGRDAGLTVVLPIEVIESIVLDVIRYLDIMS